MGIVHDDYLLYGAVESRPPVTRRLIRARIRSIQQQTRILHEYIRKGESLLGNLGEASYEVLSHNLDSLAQYIDEHARDVRVIRRNPSIFWDYEDRFVVRKNHSLSIFLTIDSLYAELRDYLLR